MKRIAPPIAAFLALASACSEPRPEIAAGDPPDPPAETAASSPSEAETVRLDAEAAARIGLTVVGVEVVELRRPVRVNGRVAWNDDRTVRAGAFVEGVITDCCLSVGARVAKGDELARLHSHLTHELLAEYRQALAALEARRSDLEYARQAYQRASRLHELRAGSLQSVQAAEAELTRAESALESAEAARAGALAHFEYLGLHGDQIERTAAAIRDGVNPQHLEIIARAPEAGVIVERFVSPGDVVTPSDPLYLISDVSSLWVYAHVPEERLADVSLGAEVEVRVRAYPDRTFPGRVTLIGSELEVETNTARIRCEVANPGGALKAGMYADVTLEGGRGERALAAPLSAIQSVDDQPTAFVEEEPYRYRAQRVELGAQSNGLVEVLSGLAEGDRVVAHGSFVLKSELLKGSFAEE